MGRASKQPLHESFRHAAEGLFYVLREERNARLHVLSAIAVLLVSAWLGLSVIEWALIIACIALVFVGEMLNTVVELTIDLMMPEINPLAKHAKDVAAGAILIASLTAAVTGLLVLGPKVWLLLSPLLRWR
ncbi:MAG: diacylglycerol kinase family protein [Chloroflexi bacterium]|jgi:diacylglycerol kinase|nr:diacylglycerol kinase family protein [Chloroflexota bacterium]